MEAIKTISDIRQKISALKKAGKTIGFVPTMGALHRGHLSLIELAKEHADAVIVSVYVNPRQFGPDEDFGEYPRTLQDDVTQCKALGVTAVFAPTDAIMYDEQCFLSIQIDGLNTHIDGGSRPGFFEGIVLVVNKLFNIIEPDLAVFGQKDIQQFQILQHMVGEFNHDVQLLMGPIIRADDGLALSSRNKYLDEGERARAPSLYRSLTYIRDQIRAGVQTPAMMLRHQRAELEAKDIKIDYLNIYDFKSLQPVEVLHAGEKYILAGAVYVGGTRLIDNIILDLED